MGGGKKRKTFGFGPKITVACRHVTCGNVPDAVKRYSTITIQKKLKLALDGLTVPAGNRKPYATTSSWVMKSKWRIVTWILLMIVMIYTKRVVWRCLGGETCLLLLDSEGGDGNWFWLFKWFPVLLMSGFDCRGYVSGGNDAFLNHKCQRLIFKA